MSQEPERITGLDLEGLALNGFVKEFKVIDCERTKTIRKSKIVAKLEDGRVVETECMEYPRISRILLVLNAYSKWGKTLVIGTEEMMSGITYDLDHAEG